MHRAPNTFFFIPLDEVTIADLPLAIDIVCCQGLGQYDLSPFPKVLEWYEEFQKTEIWVVAKECLDELTSFAASTASQ